MDLSKAFDTLNRGLLIAKLKAYSLDLNAVSLIKSYLTSRYQRCKTKDSFNEWKIITVGVPQGSILGPVLFNIFITDIFLYIENSDFCYADDSTLYASRESLSIIIEKLKVGFLRIGFLRISKWFHENFMVLNPNNCHFVVLSGSNCTCKFTSNSTTIEYSKEEKVSDISIDDKLTFTPHLRNIIKKANQKLHALSRIKCYKGFEQNKLIMSFLIKSQFSYCPLIWMFCSRTSTNKLNKIHEKCLCLITNDYDSSFNE